MRKLFKSKKTVLTAIIFLIAFTASYGQLSAPGLGKGKTASWFAFGVKQSLDSLQKKESMTYIGIGRKSTLDDTNPFNKMAILVLNQEFSNRYAKNWQYSYAISYRRQNEYESTAPYETADPAIKQEFRIYGRYSYLTGNNRLKWKNTFRQEYRKFFNPDFTKSDEDYQFRTRLKTQLNVDLGTQKLHHIIGSAEALFSISKEHSPKSEWTKFDYKESRFALYYSLTPREIPFTFDFGYAYNLIGKGAKTSGVHYLAIDVIWNNPFGKTF
ncbi:hypothetical protein ACMDB5_09340 [Flavobacterium sp. W1B]|uniref:hypothetical protein n=1 Tax=Flavobacterium sp. W1B TaxID=3394146 RepID=UPI0039BC2704